MRRENVLERFLVEQVKKRGGKCIKLDPSFYEGIPDRMILLSGARMMFIELKDPKGSPSKLQLIWQRDLIKLGFKAYILDNKKDILKTLDL